MTENKAVDSTASRNQNRSRKAAPAGNSRPNRQARRVDVAELTEWFGTLSLPITPSIKINGPLHPTAVIAVDFGAPLNPVRLTSEQVQDLSGRLRKLTRDLYSQEVNVRVSSDSQNGVFWSSVG